MSLRNAEIQTGALHVGTPDISKLSLPNVLPTGTLTCPGLTMFGVSLPGVPRAAVSIGLPAVVPPLALPFALEVIGVSNFVGATNQLGLYTCTGASFFNGAHTVTGFHKVTGAAKFTGAATFTGFTFAVGPFIAPNATINKQRWKGFDIEHPNKKGHRLRHICVEGPEAAIYVRGKVKDSETIELPEYWDGLVDYDSITVSLTPVGKTQHPYVKSVDKDKITISNRRGDECLPSCYYEVWASRIDGEPLVVEYEGESPKDYPKDPEQFSIAGYDYGRGVS